MRENLQELNTRGLSDTVPVLLGGAALTRTYVERDLREVYDGRVFYGKDAFEGLRTMDTLVQGSKNGTLDEKFGREPGGRKLPPRRSEQLDAATSSIPARSDVAIDVPDLHAAVRRFARRQGHLARRHRRRTSTRPRSSATSGSSGPSRARTTRTSRPASGPRCAPSSTSPSKEGLLVPAAAWGYFAVNSEGNDLVVWKDDTRTQEWLRFHFPRQRKAPFLCDRRLLPARSRSGETRLRRRSTS